MPNPDRHRVIGIKYHGLAYCLADSESTGSRSDLARSANKDVQKCGLELLRTGAKGRTELASVPFAARPFLWWLTSPRKW